MKRKLTPASIQQTKLTNKPNHNHNNVNSKAKQNNGSGINQLSSSNSLLNYYSVSSIHKSSIVNPSLPQVNKYTNYNMRINSKFKLVVNPSKQKVLRKPQEQLKSKEDTTHINLFNENNVLSIEQILKKEIIPDFIQLFTKLNFKIENFTDFYSRNIQNIIIKYLLISYEHLWYIPRNYLWEGTANKEHLPFITGFNDIKNISLQYHPINLQESQTFYPKLSRLIIDYISNFRKIKKTKHKHQSAWLLFKEGENYWDKVKEIETVCKSWKYEIIRWDELEKDKNAKFNKMSEATKSERISSLSEILNNKISIVESLALSNDIKWKLFSNPPNIITIANVSTQSSTQDNNNSFNLEGEEGMYNKEIIKNYNIFLLNKLNNTLTKQNESKSPEYQKYDDFKNNIYLHSWQNKSWIFIVDRFLPWEDQKSSTSNNTINNNSNNIYSQTYKTLSKSISSDDSNKSYITNIMSKVNKTKCPIILLTNNLSVFAPYIQQSSFIIEKIEDEGENPSNALFFEIALLLYLHIYIDKSSTNDIYEIIEAIEKSFSDDVMKIRIIQNNILFRLSQISNALCMKFNYNYDKIFHCLSDIFRRVSGQDKIVIVKWIEQIVSETNTNNIDDTVIDLEADDKIKESSLYKYESNSYMDYIETRLGTIAKKRRNYFESNDKQHTVDWEDYLVNSMFNKNHNIENEVNKVQKLYKKVIYSISKKDINSRFDEDKEYFKYNLVNRQHLTKREIRDYNCWIWFLMRKNDTTLKEVFNVRQTRNCNSKSDTTDNSTISYLLKLFPRTSLDYWTLYINAHTFSKIISRDWLNHKQYINKALFSNYFKQNRIIEQIKVHNEDKKTKYIEMSDDNDEDEEDDSSSIFCNEVCNGLVKL